MQMIVIYIIDINDVHVYSMGSIVELRNDINQ